jgi:succinyl-CoA synthetase beta subunit
VDCFVSDRADHAFCVQVKEAFRIITEDVKVKAILVNVFGGIVNCATIANGIVNACKSIDLKVKRISFFRICFVFYSYY